MLQRLTCSFAAIKTYLLTSIFLSSDESLLFIFAKNSICSFTVKLKYNIGHNHFYNCFFCMSIEQVRNIVPKRNCFQQKFYNDII